MIVMLQKPRFVSHHDIVEADSLLAFNHEEYLSREFNSFLSQAVG
jgi:hypothetical protein